MAKSLLCVGMAWLERAGLAATTSAGSRLHVGVGGSRRGCGLRGGGVGTAEARRKGPRGRRPAGLGWAGCQPLTGRRLATF
ncbi:hypothetical protein V8C86DRAFT_2516798 [Haematococcus lacustris]